jgi:regulator of protease activity HflC (stomatin/prohibitin superfamily)
MNPSAGRSNRSPYLGVVLLLLAGALAGTAVARVAGSKLDNPVLLALAIALGLSTGVLAGVVAALILRARPPRSGTAAASSESVAETAVSDGPPVAPESISGPAASTEATPEGIPVPAKKTRPEWVEVLLRGRLQAGFREAVILIRRWLRDLGLLGIIRIATAVAGALAILTLMWNSVPMYQPGPMESAIEVAVALIAAGLVATAVRYFSAIEPRQFPESAGLVRGARVVAWILVLDAISVGLRRFSQWTIVQILFYVILAIAAATCFGLFRTKREAYEEGEIFPLDIGVLSVLGSRTNILASVQDAVEAQFGIDLRSTWALTVVRRGLEPLVIALCVVGWLSTSLTVVGPEEQGLVERSGVPVSGPPLEPGLHIHWPWPVDKVFRIPVKRVETLTVGHEGEEQGGPENVLWAVQHAANEYTLLLGDGRDLLTIDAGVSYRISDARAWRYHCQNPADALKALSYRAVTRSIVGRSLADALSENVALWAREMKTQIQKDADTLGLGVEVVGFTVGGMHPPVPVAADYQAVVSAELQKGTSVVNAQAYRNRTLPEAEASVLTNVSGARSAAANALALAAGEAWSFRALEAQYRASPEEYYFRRRLETLEKTLSGSPFTVVDTRIQRDGGELWMIP